MGILTEQHAKMNVEEGCVGKAYRPSNGTEGDMFIASHCFECKREEGVKTSCDILARSFAFAADDKEYPTEWVYGEDGQPTCTAIELSFPSPAASRARLED